MLIKFKCETLDKELIPFNIWMLQVPFEPEEPLYYVATLNSKDNEEIVTYCEINPSLCLDKIKTYLKTYHYKPKEVTYNNMLEPQSVFAQLLVDFQN